MPENRESQIGEGDEEPKESPEMIEKRREYREREERAHKVLFEILEENPDLTQELTCNNTHWLEYLIQKDRSLTIEDIRKPDFVKRTTKNLSASRGGYIEPLIRGVNADRVNVVGKLGLLLAERADELGGVYCTLETHGKKGEERTSMRLWAGKPEVYEQAHADWGNWGGIGLLESNGSKETTEKRLKFLRDHLQSVERQPESKNRYEPYDQNYTVCDLYKLEAEK